MADGSSRYMAASTGSIAHISRYLKGPLLVTHLSHLFEALYCNLKGQVYQQSTFASNVLLRVTSAS